MAPAQSKRQSRKRRKAGQPARASAPRVRTPQAETHPAVARARADDRRTPSSLKAQGDRPPSPFGGLPISELAIFAGIVGVCVGFFGGNPAALAVGIVVCLLGVVEVTAREHFSGYRSHASLLAAIPAVGLGLGLVAIIGHGSVRRGLEGPNRSLLLVIVPVFGVLFWLLRKRFWTARQTRMIRPPSP
ncbi:MAG: hypothetical protein ACJ764_07755 [Solirubrobacteraceae bacterium]